ncbi:MAG TPA: hypothetical protein VJ608_15465 [Albitalea sp.]|nr:hypothetical protein [Albitalea sp.]
MATKTRRTVKMYVVVNVSRGHVWDGAHPVQAGVLAYTADDALAQYRQLMGVLTNERLKRLMADLGDHVVPIEVPMPTAASVRKAAKAKEVA